MKAIYFVYYSWAHDACMSLKSPEITTIIFVFKTFKYLYLIIQYNDISDLTYSLIQGFCHVKENTILLPFLCKWSIKLKSNLTKEFPFNLNMLGVAPTYIHTAPLMNCIFRIECLTKSLHTQIIRAFFFLWWTWNSYHPLIERSLIHLNTVSTLWKLDKTSWISCMLGRLTYWIVMVFNSTLVVAIHLGQRKCR